MSANCGWPTVRGTAVRPGRNLVLKPEVRPISRKVEPTCATGHLHQLRTGPLPWELRDKNPVELRGHVSVHVTTAANPKRERRARGQPTSEW